MITPSFTPSSAAPPRCSIPTTNNRTVSRSRSFTPSIRCGPGCRTNPPRGDRSRGTPGGEVEGWRDLYERERQEHAQARDRADQLERDLVAIANALTNDSMRRAFSEGPIEASIRPLIASEVFTAGDRRP